MTTESKPDRSAGVSEARAEWNSALLATVPTFVVLMLLVLANDPVLLRVLGARGDLIGLWVVVVSPLLSVFVTVVLVLLAIRIGKGLHGGTALAAVAVGALLLATTTPVGVTLWVVPALALVAGGVAVVRARRKSEGEWIGASPWLERGLTTVMGLAVSLLTSAQVVDGSVGLADAARNVVVSGLPVEVIGVAPGQRVEIFYVVQAGDQVTTVVDHAGQVENLWNADLSFRVPCDDRADWWERPLVTLVLGGPPGTPDCRAVVRTPPPWRG
ncbi:hypothetical protein [Actinokineospora enzanensis]|uniref:hypothetical protein n=1 Tax=Actinokineospora enzanensis TaxID=155975 RepID=UPI0012EC8818|nr:hypothetical protein [Actinokineospora enzanensis]